MNLPLKSIFALTLSLAAGTSALAQGLNWSAPASSANTASIPEGVSGRAAISTAVLGRQVLGAETVSGGEIMILTNGGSGTTFSNLGLVVLSGNGTSNQVFAVSGNTSPALTTLNGLLYLAYTNQLGQNFIISSNNGVDWTGPSAGPSGPNGLPTSTMDNPSLTSDLSGTIYAAYANGQSFTPIVCSWVPGVNSPNCTQYTGLDTENFNPNIVFWNGLVYLGYEHRGDSHCLFFYKYTPSTTGMTQWQPTSCDEQTSAAPALALFNNELYVAFRTNDSSEKFTIRVSTDGGNTLSFRQQPGFAMDGYPSLVNTTGTNDGPGLMNVYPRSNAVTATIGH